MVRRCCCSPRRCPGCRSLQLGSFHCAPRVADGDPGQCDIRVEVGIGQLYRMSPWRQPAVDLLRLFPTECDATGAELPTTLMVDEPTVTFLAHAQRVLIRAESLPGVLVYSRVLCLNPRLMSWFEPGDRMNLTVVVVLRIRRTGREIFREEDAIFLAIVETAYSCSESRF